MGTPLELENPFWRFSLAVYPRPGVADECLAAQAAHGLDVNLLLFCAWIGADRGVRLDAGQIDAAAQAVARWHASVVRPLRAARQAIKTLPEMEDAAVRSLRKAIAADELRAEQVEQAILWAAADPDWPRHAGARETAVRANVSRYVETQGGAAALTFPRLLEEAVRVAAASAAPPANGASD